MTNKVRGEISADFQDTKINLILTTDAICRLEAAADRSANDIFEEIEDPKRLRMTTVRLVFWALMLKEKPDATIEEAGELIDGLRGNYSQLMADAILAAYPDPVEGETPEK